LVVGGWGDAKVGQMCSAMGFPKSNGVRSEVLMAHDKWFILTNLHFLEVVGRKYCTILREAPKKLRDPTTSDCKVH
jgi:hypothetical protein